MGSVESLWGNSDRIEDERNNWENALKRYPGATGKIWETFPTTLEKDFEGQMIT